MPRQQYDLELKSNPASEPRSKLVRDLVFKDGIIKKVAAKTIKSSAIKKNIKNTINKFNKKELKEISVLDKDLKRQIYNLYFKEEILFLEEFLNLDLDSWKN